MAVRLRIKELLAERGWTQKELAEKANLRPAAVSNLSNNFLKSVSLEHIDKIMNALEITDFNKLFEKIEK